MPKQKLVIGHLYGDLMNIYGDMGNIITLQKRAQWRGYKVEVKNISMNDQLASGEVDVYFFGGGQDQAQRSVAEDLIKSGKAKVIKEDIERGVPLLSICGGYQLLGDYYQPHNEAKIIGAELFPAYTEAGNARMIGNIVIHGSLGELVGFENHSGQTFLKESAQPLGQVQKGFGNNGTDKTEGCIYKNAIGCYMHGSLLPKNPQLADWLLIKALDVKYGQKMKLQKLPDQLEEQAHQTAVQKFG